MLDSSLHCDDRARRGPVPASLDIVMVQGGQAFCLGGCFDAAGDLARVWRRLPDEYAGSWLVQLRDTEGHLVDERWLSPATARRVLGDAVTARPGCMPFDGHDTQ